MENANPLRILFVEDLPSDAILAERVIRKSGLEFSSQRVDTKDAMLKALKEFRPDVVVSDYSMPEFDGMRALKLSLAYDFRIPFILLTGSMNEETAVECMKAGATDYVIKEHMSRLPFAVKDALEQKNMRTAKVEAERAFRESEERLRSIIDSATDLVFLKDTESRYLLVNLANQKFFGRANSEIVGKTDFDLMPREMARGCHQSDRQVIDHNQMIVSLEEVNDKVYESRKFPVKQKDGKVGVGGFVRDVTDRRRLEGALSHERYLLLSLLDNIPDHIYFKDADSRFMRINKAQADTFGLSDPAQAIGKTDFDFFTKEHARKANEDEQEIMRTGQPLVNMEERETWPDGRETYVSTTKVPLRDSTGRITGTFGISRDITDRKRTEMALLTREQQLNEAQALSHTGSWDWDALADTTICSAELYRIFDRDPQTFEFSLQEFLESPLPDDREKVKNLVQRMFEDRAPGSFEFRISTRGGKVRWVHSSATLSVNDAGGIARIQGTVQDITERKQAEEELKKSEGKFRAIFDNASDGMFLIDLKDRKIFESNAACTRMLGYSQEEFSNLSIADMHPREDLPFVSEQIGKFSRGEEGIGSDIRFRRKDGSILDTDLSPALLTIDGKKSLLIMFKDITERKRAEESRLLLTTAIQASAKGVVITDLKGSIVWVNRAFTVMTGYPQTEVMGQNPKFLNSGKQDDSFYKDLWETISAGNVWAGELINKRKDGTLYSEEMIITPVNNQENKLTHFVALKQDITSRKNAERDLRLSEERFRSVWDNSADGMRLTDREGRIIDVNAAFCKLVRKSREELLGKVFSVAYRSHGPDDNLSLYHKRFDAGETISAHLGPVTLWNGESFDLDASSSYIETVGQERLLLCLFRDVTEQKKSEKRLEEERTLLRTIIDAIPDEICVKDIERRFVLVNPATLRALKRSSQEEIIGKRDEDLIPEKFALMAKEEEDAALKSGSAYLNRVGDSRINPLTGEIERSILISKIPLKDNTGKVVGLVGINRDITEVQRVTAALEKERTLLLTLIESIPDEVCLKDLAHRFLVVNSGIVRAIGARSIQDLLGKTDFDYMSPEIAQGHFDEEDALLETGQPIINLEKITLNPITGEIDKCMLTTKVPVKDSTGKNIGILVVNRRNTERKRAEEELKSSEERLRILFEYAPDAHYLTDLKGTFLDGNKAAEELSGFAREELIGKNFFELGLLPREDVQKASQLLGLSAQGFASGPSEFTLKRNDNSQVEVEIRTYPVTINNEVQVLGIARDVSQRKRSEEALRASEEKFRALFEESKDIVYFSTVDGRLLDINPAGFELLGYGSKDDLQQIDLIRDGYADAKDKQRFDQQMEAHGFVRDFEITLKQKDGGKLTLLETATAVRDKDGKIVQYRGIMRDVTKQRQLEAQFLQAQKMESIGTLAGGIAHDFNNILGIVLGHLALLERTRKNDTQFEESIFSISKAVERGASLVRQILTFARKTETELEPVNINSMIKELGKMFDETFPKTIEITQKLDKTIPIILMDPTQLHQTLLNLCVNARDAMNGQGTLTVATHLVLGRDVLSRFPKATAHHYVRVSVKDTGTGMDEETRQRIFEPFFTTKEKGKGTGLGLAVVYGVLLAHNGFIDVESAPGVGTTFHLFFPVPEGILATSEEQIGPKEALPRGSETILVVEDEDVLRDLLVKLLQMQGYTVITACDGVEAVVRFTERSDEIDLVLSDMGLPKRSGWDAFRMMKKIKPNVRTLFATGYVEPGQKSEILKSGVMRFIHKPYRMEEVIVAIRETLDKQ